MAHAAAVAAKTAVTKPTGAERSPQGPGPQPQGGPLSLVLAYRGSGGGAADSAAARGQYFGMAAPPEAPAAGAPEPSHWLPLALGAAPSSAGAAGDPPPSTAEGRPLDPGNRRGAEEAFGRSFEDVRIHTDGAASLLTKSLSARAVTWERQVAFAPGQYRPGTLIGDALIAHELAHVVQQSRAAQSGPLRAPEGTATGSEASLEQDAERAAAGVLLRSPVHGPTLRSLRGPAGAATHPGAHLWTRLALSGGPRLAAGPRVQLADDEPGSLTTLDPTYTGAVRPAEDPLRHTMIYERGRGLYTGYHLDLDGDQSADVIVELEGAAKDKDGNITELRVTLTQLNPSSRQAHEFTVSRPELRVQPWVKRVETTDGINPTILTLPNGRQPVYSREGTKLWFDPPREEDGKTVVQSHIEWGDYVFQTIGWQYVFPRAKPTDKTKPKRFTVFHPGTPRTHGPYWFLDFTAGAFGDPFRLVLFKADPNATAVTVGIVALEGGKPLGGGSADIAQMPPRPLSVGVVKADETEMALDLDGDGAVDLSIIEQLEAEEAEGEYDVGPFDVTQNRRHNFRVGRHPQFDITPIASIGVSRGRFSRYTGRFEITSLATAVETVPKQAATGGYVQRLIAIEQARRDLRRAALDSLRARAATQGSVVKRAPEEPIFTAWDALSNAILDVQIAAAGVVPGMDARALGRTAATRARALYKVLEPATRNIDAIESWEHFPRGGFSLRYVTNPYTGETVRESIPAGVPRAVTTPADTEIVAQKLEAGQWDLALYWYTTVADRFDAWVASRLRQIGDPEQAARLSALKDLDRRLRGIADKNPQAVHAVFHPLQTFQELKGIEEFKLILFYWKEGSTWYLIDLTNPEKTFTLEHPAGTETEPPHALFEKLDRRAHFVKGWIHYQIPGGRVGRVETTEKKEYSDYFAYAAAALGAAALILATAGAGSIIVTVCIVGASAAGAIAAGLDIKEKSEQGILTTYELVVDVAQIAACLAGGAGAVAREVKLAQQALVAAGDVSKLSAAARILAGWGTVARYYKPLTVAAAAADAISFLAYLPGAAQEFEAIEKGPGDAADRTRARVMLAGRLFVQGALTVLSVRGNLSELSKLGNWEVGIVNGRPVARVPAGTYAEADYASELAGLLKGTAAEHAQVEVKVLAAKDFEARFASKSGDAVVAFENGKPKLFVREGAVKSAVLEEAAHVQQAADPRLAPLVKLLDESKLATWASLAPAEKLAMVSAKLRLEIDAQRRVTASLRSKSSLTREEYVQLDNAWQNTEHLRGKFAEWAALSQELKTTKAIAGDPELLKQPPRLFTKPTTASFDLLDTWKNMTPEAFLASYKARYPNTSLTDAELLQRFADGKRLNPETWRLASATRREEAVPDVRARTKPGTTETFMPEGGLTAEGTPLALTKTAKARRDALIAERDAARAQRDALLKTVPPDEAAAAKIIPRINEPSRQLGELHADAFMAQKHPDFVRVYPPPGAKSRPGDFDQVWQRVKVTKTGEKEFLSEHIVIEAKGGASGLGSRQVGPIRAEQGTQEYFDAIIAVMKKGTPEMQAAAQALEKAGPEAVHYLLVKVPIESGAPSTVTKVIVSEFDLAPAATTP